MKPGPLDFLPLWGFYIAATACALLAVEGGYRLGRWRHAHVADEKDAPVGAMVGSILALLAIILAFTFNLAASRYDLRRQTVLDEANAVGTTFLRARLLPEPQRAEVAGLLREYVDVRLSIVREHRVSEGLARSEKLHEELWSRGVAAAEKSPTPVTALFLNSLNEMIDLHATRVMFALRNRLPAAIWGALFGLALIGMSSMGYQSGLSATSRSPAMALLALAFAAVLLLIVSLDRADDNLLPISQQAMIDLQRSMEGQTQ